MPHYVGYIWKLCLKENVWQHPSSFEPEEDTTYNKTCATSKELDQPAHLRSLIRIFADRMYLLQPAGYPKRDEREPLHSGWMYRLIWFFAVHIRLIVGFAIYWLILLHCTVLQIWFWYNEYFYLLYENLIWNVHIQSNLNNSNTDGLFTMANSNLFLVPTKFFR